jgi:hypothetical protein
VLTAGLFSFDSTFNTLMVCRWDRLVFMNLWSAQRSVICRRCKKNLELYRTLERSNVAIDSDHPIPTKMYLTIRTKIIYLDRRKLDPGWETNPTDRNLRATSQPRLVWSPPASQVLRRGQALFALSLLASVKVVSHPFNRSLHAS